jgi:fumarate hydratase class II
MNHQRVERDSLGEIAVPASCYWGAQTERARRTFQISGLRLPRRIVTALGLLKAVAADVNVELGVLATDLGRAIAAAALEIAAGQHLEEFPLDVFQTGSGTSTNMNANEVIASRASELLGGERGGRLVHPNDHVNAGQSSNDVIPTVLHLAALGAVVEDLEPALTLLLGSLEAKAEELDEVVKTGRTHLQDAVPVRLGQELSGHAQQVRNGLARVSAVKPRLAELALGGTAVGTGLNAPAGFADAVIARLREATGLPLQPAPNRFEALAGRDACVELSSALKVIAVSLTKIANDLRWLASGPRCGLGEIRLPALQPGSSIMPGKVNPVVPEAVLMVAAQVIGNDAAITVAGLSGNFELNVMMPLIAYDLLQSIELLSAASRLLATHCVDGVTADRERAAELVERSLALATALVPRIGYDAAAAIAQEALQSGRTLREVARERAGLSVEELERILDARRMTEGGRLS